MSKMNLSIAYDMKKRNKKKMAKGGMIQKDVNDSQMIQRNDEKKTLTESQWTDQPTVKQAQKPSITPLSRPKMAESSVLRTRMRDQEEDQMGTMKPDGYGKQPPEIYNEKDADKQGPSVPALKMKMMAEGGMINKAVSMDEAEEDNVQHPEGLEETDSSMSPAKDEYMADHFAEGGMIDDEAEMEHEDSIAAAIMAKKARQQKLDSDSDEDEMAMFADGGMVDIDSNGEEQSNQYYRRNQEALKENYDSDMDDVSQPTNSNLQDVEIDSDEHDMVSKIRSKMNKDRQFKVR